MVSMKDRCLIRLLLLQVLFCVSCPQQPEEKSLPEKVARGMPAFAKKEPPKIIHIADETIGVSPKTGKLTGRGKGGAVEIYATEETIIHIGRDNSRLSDIATEIK